MKRTLAVALLATLTLFALMGMGGNKQEPASTKPQFGVVDMAKLYQESKAGKAGVERLETLQNEAVATLEGMQAVMAKAEEDKDEALSQRTQVEMQGLLYSMQNLMTVEQERVVEIIKISLEKSLEQYRAENGLTAIFSSEAVQAYDKQADVTAGVMAMYDNTPVDFGPKPTFDTPAAPAGAVAPAESADPAEATTPEAAPGAETTAPEATPGAETAPEISPAAETTAPEVAPAANPEAPAAAQ